MTENKLDDFLTFLKDHLNFNVCEITTYDIPDRGTSLIDASKYATNSIVVKCNNKSMRAFEKMLVQKQKDAILYFQTQFANHKDAAVFILNESVRKLKVISDGFNAIEFNRVQYASHDNVSVYNEIEKIYIPKVELTEFHFKYISESISIQNRAISELLESYENTMALLTGTPSLFKLKTKLKVAELSLFYRLLDEEGIFLRKHETEVYRMIANSFSTEKMDNLSANGIKKKFLDIDEKTFDSISQLLHKLRQRFNKLKENYSK
ncbi:MAG: hypothetical protein HQ521_07780 [Bacteroidetes bacterium]|nr:hypothetical protein [Bacteroidota bacterium]